MAIAVSIIIPYYKGEKFLDAAICSVRNQTSADWELIVVDDGSPDEGISIAEEHASLDPRICVLRTANFGVSHARNTGVARSDPRSEYLLFLDCDDELEPDALVTMTSCLNTWPEVGAAYFSHSVIDEQGQVISSPAPTRRYLPAEAPPGWKALPMEPSETPLVSLLAHHDAVPSITLFRRQVYEKTSGWDEAFRHAFEDQDIIWQCALLAPVYYIPKLVARKRDHPHNNVKQSLTPGFRQLARKWWQGAHLDPVGRARVRSAMTAETLLTARLIYGAAEEAARKREFVQAGQLAYSAFRKMALYVTRTLRSGGVVRDVR